jgi:hypothetical protein
MSRAFANLDGLMRLSRTDGIDIRPALLRVITDLFVQEATHTREEVQQYAELSLRLLPVVDAQTRSAVIAKLTIFSGTPAWLLEQVGSLPAEMPASTGPDETIESIVSGAERIAPAPAAKPGAAFGPAASDDLPAHGLGADTTATRHIGERFLRAEPAERRALLLQLEETHAATREPSWFRSRKRMVDRLEAAAQEHDPREFARELQQSFGLSSRIAGEIVYDDGGEPLLVAAKAADMEPEILLRVLLLLNPAVGESVERVFSLYRLYQRIGLAAVTPIMASWREDSRARPKARYQPLHAPDEGVGRTGTWDSFRTATESQRDQGGSRPAAPITPVKRHGTT